MGILSLGIVDADALVDYSIAAFFFTVLFLAGLLRSGKYANRKKRFHEFLSEKISELESEAKGKEAAKKQAAEHEKKIKAAKDASKETKNERYRNSSAHAKS